VTESVSTFTPLPAAAYRDPEQVVADAETGDVAGQKPPAIAARHCLTCLHVRSAFAAYGRRRHPCALGCTPSPREWVCRCWKGRNGRA